ncbi:MAG: hypothetical protein JST26_01190 [Bacteroidetes bacterium]|nr:hypothetical protein [Bacteroidota bacterium]
MSKQSYTNHIRYYLPHHVYFYSCIIAGTAFSGAMIYFHHGSVGWIIACILFVLVGWLSFMLRQHYALMLQNRIVRLEMRFRYFALCGKRFEPLEAKLSFGQIAALRFASDEELEALVAKAVDEHLAADAIKRSIKNWQADDMRV